MATEAQASASTDQESRPTTEARDDCAITRPGATIPIPIFDNDGAPAHTPPPLLQVSAVPGHDDLYFSPEGKALYTPTDQRSEIHFQYQAEDHGNLAKPAEVFVLVSGGPQLLSDVVGPPHDVGHDVRVANACSQGKALKTSDFPAPGATLHGLLGPAHHVTVAVDKLAGETLPLDKEQSLQKWTAITVHGGVDLFDKTGVIFLKGLTDNSNIHFKLAGPHGTSTYSAKALWNQGEHGEPTVYPPAEIARSAIFQTTPGEETHVGQVFKIEFPRCGEQCKVFAYNGDAVVVREPDHVQSLQLWPDDLQFAGPLLAANSDDAGAGAAVQSALGIYWLERDPTASVVVIDHFFEHPGGANPPELSVAESHFVSANVLWNLRQPVDLPGFEGHGPVYLIAESAFPPRDSHIGPEHGGGAGFTPYDAGSIGEGLIPLLALPPTELPPRELPPPIVVPPPIGGNRSPVGEDDHGPLVQVGGPPVPINVLANDHDPDGDPLTIVVPRSSAHPSPTPLGGTVAAEGQHLLYTPPGVNQLPVPDQPGRLSDHFIYTIDDGHHHQATAQVTVAVNRAPEAAGDAAQIEGHSVVIDVLTNDHDPDGDPLKIVSHGLADHGDVQVIDHDTQILYTRTDAAEPLADSFTYTIDDGRGGHATAVVAVSDGPIPHISPSLTIEPTSVTLPVVGDFSFVPGLQSFPQLHEGQAADSVNGVDGRNLTLDVARTLTVSFISETAGFHNSLGFYTVVNGAPTNPHILFSEVDNGVLKAGPSPHISGLPGGTQLGLFLVPDGARAVDGHTDFAFRETNGHWELVPSEGGKALPVFFTNSEFNADGQIHALSGRVGDAFRIGFEDLTGGGDRDFNDAVVQVSYGHVVGPGLDLTAQILDPDSAEMSGASVTISLDTRQPGDNLFLTPDDVLGGTGITVTGQGTNELRFSGLAPSATYERVLEGVRLEVSPNHDQRELDFQVSDDTHLTSNDAKVAVGVNLVHSTATAAADALPSAPAGPDHAAVMASLVGTEQAAT
jgi:hypothetical protein